jgi:uncharacterized protein (TIGR03089 family)
MTFPTLLESLLRQDPGRPLVTYYGETDGAGVAGGTGVGAGVGERVELSVATYANWVAKTASLFIEELDLERGQSVYVGLPTHWLGPVFAGAAWACGLGLVTAQEKPDLAVVGPDGVEPWAADPSRTPVLACSLRPMGVRFADPLPAGVHDFGVEVWSQPDAFVPFDPPEPDDAAAFGLSQADLWASKAPGERLLTTDNPVTPEGLATFTGPLSGGGSTIWVRDLDPRADPAAWQRRYNDERATRAQP